MSPVQPFVHLHTHTYYSLLDGANPIDTLAERAKAFGMPAVAMTDHGNLFGALEFYQTMREAGIKPIIGCEVYLLTKGSLRDRDARGGEGFLSHLTLLARNNAGYKNLCQLSSIAHLEGFYYKPRIDKATLAAHADGLLCLTGCMNGEIARHLQQDDTASARQMMEWLLRTFGDDSVFVEIMRHGLDSQAKANPGLIALAQAYSRPLVATNDCHYGECGQAAAHDALLCIQTGKNIADEKRLKMDSDQFYFRSGDEMAALFADLPDAVTQTVHIAELCTVEFDLGTYHFPKFEAPPGKTLDDLLREQTLAGFEQRWPLIRRQRKLTDDALRVQYETRLTEELACIINMGFAGYFLIVADFIHFAKSHGIPVGPGRGSAAGSIVAYALNITDVDPLPFGLFFERFLNPERISMPDMDIDFCMRRREEVIQYVQQKYGNVGQIITFGKMKAKAVIRDVARVMGIPYGDADRLAKLIPNTLGITLQDALDQEPRLRDMAEQDPKIAQLLTTAQALEGFPRHASTHAAGLVISDRPLTEFLPLARGTNGETITQFDMKGVEKIGLIKFDFLGLRTLTILYDAIELIVQRGQPRIDLNELPLDDAAVYEMLSRGDTAGVFQVESSGMTDLAIRLKPSVFEDIVALVALFRPGPLGRVDDFIDRKHGRTKVTHVLPQLEPILHTTYGIILYQEQVMHIASALANYSLGEADLLRRAMGKKKPEEMAKQKARFLRGAMDNNLDPRRAEQIFDLMEKFAGYGFNKCVVGSTEVMDTTTGSLHQVEHLFRDQHLFSTASLDQYQRVAAQPVTHIHDNGCQQVFEIHTQLGHTLTITNNHPLLTIDGWQPLLALAQGARIAVPRRLPCPVRAAPWKNHAIVTLAWLLSEGNTCHPSSLYMYNNDRAAIDDFVQAVSQFPHTTARIDTRRDGRMEVCVNTGQSTQFVAGNIPWNSNAAVQLAPEERHVSGAFQWALAVGVIGKKAHEKTIPTDVFHFNAEQLALFIARMWSGDGFICGAGTNTVPFYASASEMLIRQLQHLLLRLGLPSRIAKKQFRYRQTYKPGFALYLTGEGTAETFVRVIGPHLIGRARSLQLLRQHLHHTQRACGSRDTIPQEVKCRIRALKAASGYTWTQIEKASGCCMKEFYGGLHTHKRGFRRGTIKKLGDYFGCHELLRIAESDIFWDEITAIIPRGVQQTYDLTVAETHNFVANNIIVHNSHSVAYALIAYHTAYFKTHHPTEFFAATLTNEMGNTDKVLQYLTDAKEHDITVLPPDVNTCEEQFKVIAEHQIRFGLAAVKNVGESAIESIVAARTSGGPFRDLFDFCDRVECRRVNRRVIESLIKCGAFDSLGTERGTLWGAVDAALEHGAARQHERESGQENLFAALGDTHVTSPQYTTHPPWEEAQRLAGEKEILGFYITGHPLTQHRAILATLNSHRTDTLRQAGDKRPVRLGGVVAALRETTTKRGDRMGFVTLEDLHGTVEIVVFSEAYLKRRAILQQDQPIFVLGTTDANEESVKIICDDIVSLEEAPQCVTRSVHFSLQAAQTAPALLTQLQQLLQQYRGACPAFLHVMIPDHSETVMKLSDDFRLLPSAALVNAVNQLFGADVTRFDV